MFVDALEEGGVGDEEAAEGGDDGLLFNNCVGAMDGISDHDMGECGKLQGLLV